MLIYIRTAKMGVKREMAVSVADVVVVIVVVDVVDDDDDVLISRREGRRRWEKVISSWLLPTRPQTPH